ncbi:hypothetical protein [Sellimonas sp.]|uniref:hypothetical protein n=1 Tax=Sellimonas sp. TaxID=2021466 RepID=UPI000B3ACA15|nr:hypothetical protein [Sellimonas sp.]OUP00946.1 hypothetical protein B5F37_09465 [Drancourtella sp. An210]OUP62763.1 hypothetical protein B5F13_12475 [Drancourtella sp. An177]
MKEKMKWIVLLFMMAMVLWGIQKAESVVTEGKSRMQKADVVIDAGHGGSIVRGRYRKGNKMYKKVIEKRTSIKPEETDIS